MRVTGMLRPTRTITVLPHMSTPGNVLAHIKGTVWAEIGLPPPLRARGVLVRWGTTTPHACQCQRAPLDSWWRRGCFTSERPLSSVSPRVLSSRTLWFSVGVPGRRNRPQQGILVMNKTMATRIGKHVNRASMNGWTSPSSGLWEKSWYP